jgi:hypothetical protein
MRWTLHGQDACPKKSLLDWTGGWDHVEMAHPIARSGDSQHAELLLLRWAEAFRGERWILNAIAISIWTIGILIIIASMTSGLI